MKVGDLVVTTRDHTYILGFGFKVTPFMPIKDETVCTVAWIEGDTMKLEEVQVLPPEGRGIIVHGWDTKFWRVIESPDINIEELVKESISTHV